MKLNILYKTMAAAVIFIFQMTAMHALNIITVDNANTNAADYTSLQDAINAASGGDVIYVQPSSTTYGDINVTKPLTIIGRSWNEGGYITYTNTFNIKSSNVSVKGLHIQNGLNIEPASSTPISNISVKDSRTGVVQIGYSNPVSNVTLQGNSHNDRIYQYAHATNLIVMNNYIVGGIFSHHAENLLYTQNIMYQGGLYNLGDVNSILQVSNSMFFGGYYYGTNVHTQGRFKAQNCLTWSDYYGTLNFANAGNPLNSVENCILSTNPQLVQYLEIDGLQLAPGSPAIGAGLEGKDIGIYQDYAFSWEGNPVGYPTLTIDSAPSSASAGTDLEVTVTAEAH